MEGKPPPSLRPQDPREGTVLILRLSTNLIAVLLVFRRNIAPAAVHDFHRRCPDENYSKEGIIAHKNILEWIGQPRSDSQAQIAWLIGSTDVERESVAYSVARICARDKRLAASFFSPPQEAAKSQSASRWLVATLGYQISRLDGFEWFTRQIQNAIQGDMDIFSRPLTTQFEKLILEPLRQANPDYKPPPRPMIIVIEGLERWPTHCTKDIDLAEIYTALARASADPAFTFLILVTSPPGNFIYSDARSFKPFFLGGPGKMQEVQCLCWKEGNVDLEMIERLGLPDLLGVTLPSTAFILNTLMNRVHAQSVHPKLAGAAQNLLFVLDADEVSVWARRCFLSTLTTSILSLTA